MHVPRGAFGALECHTESDAEQQQTCEYRYRPVPPSPHRLQGGPGPLTVLELRFARSRALRQLVQPLRNLSRAQPPPRNPVDRCPDVLADEIILDVTVPSRRQRLAELADDYLIQPDAERIDVCARRRCLPLDDFRGHVEPSARIWRWHVRAGGQSGRCDTRRTKPRFIGQHADTEVTKPYPHRAVRVTGHQDISRLD